MYQSKFLFTQGIPFPTPSPPTEQYPQNFDFLTSWPNNPISIASQWYQEAESKFFELTNGIVSETQQWPNTIQLSTIGLDLRPKIRTILLKGIDSKGFLFFTNYNGGKGNELTQNPYCSINLYWKYCEKQLRIEGKVERIDPLISDAYFHSRPFGSQLGGITSPQSQSISSHAALEWHYVQNVKLATKFLLQKATQISLHSPSTTNKASEKALQLIHQYLPEFLEEIESSNKRAMEMGVDSGKVELPKMLELLPYQNLSGVGGEEKLPVIDEAVHSLHSRCLSVLTQFDIDPDLSILAKGILKRPDHWGGFRLIPNKIEFWQDGMFRLHSRITYVKKNGENESKGNGEDGEGEWVKTFLSP